MNEQRVIIQEVGPRDGLQNESRCLSVQARARLIDRLTEAGIRRIQIGSFVNPRLVPQMADTDEVWRLVSKSPNTRYSVLVLNRRGLEQALAARIPHVEIFVSASETHSLKNSGVTISRGMAEASAMIEVAAGAGASVTAGVMCAFGCHFEGQVPVSRVRDMIAELELHHPEEIGLADTTGMAQPAAIATVIRELEVSTSPERLAIHLHDTRGFGLANLKAALDMGIRRFDASVGGLGGCPFVPGATGNIATEMTVKLLERLGFSTGIDAEKLSSVKDELQVLLGRSLDHPQVPQVDLPL